MTVHSTKLVVLAAFRVAMKQPCIEDSGVETQTREPMGYEKVNVVTTCTELIQYRNAC